MKLGFAKRVLAIGICAVMLFGDNMLAAVTASVSGGDAAALMQETVAVSGNDAAEIMNMEATVSGNDMEILVQEDTVLVKEVSGVTITLTAPAGAIPENAELWAEEIKQVEELALIDEALEAEAEKEEIEVQKYKAFDIKILVDGEEVQPQAGVTVSFAGDVLLPEKEEEEVAVYHVTEDAQASNMEATVTEANEVEMETDHFSIYVITVSMDASQFEYDVTIQHKLAANPGTPFYKDLVQTITKNENLMVGVQGGGDYKVTSVVIQESKADSQAVTVEAKDITTVTNTDGTFLDLNMEPYEISSDATVTVYYEPATSTFVSDVTYFDYSILTEGESGYVNKGINANGFDANGNAKSNYLAMGINGFFHNFRLEMVNPYDNGNVMDANENNSNNPSNNYAAEYDHKAIAQGLVTGLSAADGYQTVLWGTAANGEAINEPGYFTATEVPGKTIYSDRFDLQFSKDGHKYVLDGSIDTGNGNKLTQAGQSNTTFFPLNAVAHYDTATALENAGANTWEEPYRSVVRNTGTMDFDSAIGNNCYFGMRYDFKFTVGDYVGDLQYTFVGDDDLWVFMDGKLVLDLGGIHSAYPSAYQNFRNDGSLDGPSNVVDLWQFVKDENGNYDSNATHQITVLYMERGGYDSTCYMEFILPNATAMKSVISSKPTTSFGLTKVDENGTGVGGAVFELKNLASGEVETATSDANGNVSFFNVYEGSYTLKEAQAPSGYVIDGTQYSVNVANNNGSWSISGLPADNKVVNKKLTNLHFKKVDKYTQAALAGASFELRDASGAVVGTATTAADGNFAFTNLLSGSYTLRETQAPGGYAAYDDVWTIQVNAYAAQPIVSVTGPTENLWLENNQVFAITNEKTVDLTIVKEWMYENGTEMEDVDVNEVTVYLKRRHTGVNNCDDCNHWSRTIVLSKANDWKVVVEDLEERDTCGTFAYYVEEEKVEGYVASYGTGRLEETAEGYAQTLTVTNTPATGSLVITKTVDEINMAYGAPTFTFKIVGPEGTLYRTITFEDAKVTTKSITVEGIRVGEYTVTELETFRYTLNEQKSDHSSKVVKENVAPVFSFYNELTNREDYSHSDVVVNGFRTGDNSEVSISQSRQVIE